MANQSKYKKLKVEAKNLYVSEGLTAQEIANRLGISQKTMSVWVRENDEAWKREREVRMNSTSKQGDNIREIISMLSEQRIELMKQVMLAEQESTKQIKKGASEQELTLSKNTLLELRKQAASIDDAVSKWNKTLQETAKGGNRITLAIFLNVMDSIFDKLRQYDAEIYNKTLDFQERLINEQTRVLG